MQIMLNFDEKSLENEENKEFLNVILDKIAEKIAEKMYSDLISSGKRDKIMREAMIGFVKNNVADLENAIIKCATDRMMSSNAIKKVILNDSKAVIDKISGLFAQDLND